MKRNLRSFVAIVLCILMSVPFSTIASAALFLPTKPNASSDSVVYTAHTDAFDENGVQYKAAVGNNGTSISDLYLTSAFSYWLNLFNETGALRDGGTFLVAGKAFVPLTATDWGNRGVIPATSKPIVFTAKDPVTGYSFISKNEDGSIKYMNEAGGNVGQYGMFMIDAKNLLTFEGDVIFKDIVILNRQNATSAKNDAPAVFNVKGKMVIDSSVQFARMSGGVMYHVNVAAGAYLYLNTLGFDNYTGSGTIVVGDEIKNTVTAEDFSDFCGKVVDKNGNVLFNNSSLGDEPVESSDKVIYLSFDNKVASGIPAISSSIDGGDTATNPYSTNAGKWGPLFSEGKAKDGGKIVIVGKGHIGANLIIPETTHPIVFTSRYNGIDYVSYKSDGTYDASGTTGQFGSVMLAGGDITLTVKGSVILDDTVVFNRNSKPGTIKVDGTLVVKDNVSFETLTAGKEHELHVSAGGTAYLHSLGFGSYLGAGTIVIGDEIIDSVTEEMFQKFDGSIFNEQGKALFVKGQLASEKPVANGTDKLYISFSATNANGTAAADNGGNSESNAYRTGQNLGWANLFSENGTATSAEGKTNYLDGGTIVVVGKSFIASKFTFPATSNTLVITAKDGDTSYVSRNDDGTPDTSAQLGMFMTDPNYTITFEGDVIFRDIVFINRQTSASLSTKTPTVYSVKSKLLIENTVEFASIAQGGYYILNVEENGIAFVDSLGFGKYTGCGTIVLGPSVIDSATKDMFVGFDGLIVDEMGNELFADRNVPERPSANGTDKIYVSYNTSNPNGSAAVKNGGDSVGNAYCTSLSTWTDLLSSNGSAVTVEGNSNFTAGGTIVFVGKGYIGTNFTVPATTNPLVFTAKDGDVSYISRNEDGTLDLDTTSGQRGMFFGGVGNVITFDGDVIFRDIVILNRQAKSVTFSVNGNFVVEDSVEFAAINGSHVVLNVAEGGVAFLDAAGFGGYTGNGTIVIGNNVKNNFTKDDFANFEGKIIDEDGNEMFAEDEILTGTSGDCTYTYNWTTETLVVSGNGSPASTGLVRARFAKHVVFEEGVTAIPDNFCFNNSNLETVTIASTITSIGRYAFGNTTNLTTVTIPENSSIASVGFKAFLFSGITSISFNDNLKTIDGYAFRGCDDLVSVDLGNSVESIGEYAFGYAAKLESITFGGTLTAIADNTFNGAKALKTIVIPDTVTTIGIKAFMNAQSLATVDFPDSVTIINSDAFKDTGLVGEITLPASVTTLGDRVFYRCTNLTKVDLPADLTSMGSYVFGLSSITSASIPQGITTIPAKTFYKAESLVSVEIGAGVTAIDAYAFAASGITNIVIPETCTTLANGIFWSCTKLTSATVNASVSAIPSKMFYNCSALTSVTFSENTMVTEIADHVFYGCASLSEIALPDDVTSIGSYVFSHSGISSITLPAGITVIPAKAFEKCASLTSFNAEGDITAIGDYAFAESGITSFVIPENCMNLGTGVFYNCDSLKTVVSDAPLKAITYKMFYSCGALTTFDIPDTVTSIRPYAFYMCTYLSDIGEGGIPSGLKYLYNHAFAGTSRLKIDVHLPGTLLVPPAENLDEGIPDNGSVGYYCFKSSGITGVTFGEGIESIAYASFYECRNMGNTVIIPSSCTRIGGKAFANTPILDVYIPATVTEIASLAFYRKVDSDGNKLDPIVYLHTEETAETVIEWAAANANEVTLVTDYTPDATVTVPDSYNKQFDANKSYGMYNYCPSVMQVDEDTMYIYYCTNKTGYNVTDYIGFREATKNADGTWTWSAETIVLSPTSGTWDARHVCDPSVVMGDFTYNGEQYSYLMAYLGCVTSDNQENEIGLAIAKAPNGPFVKVGTDAFIGFDRDTTVDQSIFQWGVGQASLINVNKQGEIMIFYTMGAASGTHTMVETWNLSDLNNPVKMTETARLSETGLKTLTGKNDIINNADFVYDAASKRFYASSDCHPNPSDEPNFISSDFRVTYFNDTGDFSKITWRTLCTVGADDTGFARNHNTGILRDGYGHLANDYISVYYTVSNTGSSSLWSYRIYDFHTPKA